MADTARLAIALEDRYRIERELGAGGMATVYLARDLKHDREVALKVLRPELGAVLGADRFLAEIKITARLDHPHILTLIDSGASGGFLYYVLPLVRGESLRDLLNREQQLGLEQALAITRQIASALDYAHQHGVVHRDIKPENILIHEGEAVLADFGIALAVKEAGGNRLTETGLSLGTPQYMSPEQATGDRQLDARSDVYSLGAVLYEMLAGEPPVTGPTAQAMIAKLMTERPTRLRIVRDTVPEGIDVAVAKALAKIPADRFASAGDFNRALGAAPVQAHAAGSTAARPRALVWGVGVAALAVVAVLGALIGSGRLSRHAAVTLGAKTQLTFTGGVIGPSISPDGKQLAYIVKDCTESDCRFAIEVQDVGGTTTRRVIEHLTAAYGVSWSPDRRNLLTYATINGRWGGYLLSALGGPPRLVGFGAVAFYAGGDSLLVGPPPTQRDSAFWVRVTTLDGAVRDSFKVLGPGDGLAGLFTVPDAGWVVAMVVQHGRGLWQVLDRHGKVVDQVLNHCTCGGTADRSALWLVRSGSGLGESIVRIGLDPATGRLASRQDTLYAGQFTGVSVTADGGALVVDQGTYEHSTWAVELADALRGRFPESRRILRASTPVFAGLSPDGTRLLIRRTLPAEGGHTEDRFAVRAFEGGAETALNMPGSATGAFWEGNDHIVFANPRGHGQQFNELDVRTNSIGRTLEIADSVVGDWDVLPDAWIWIPAASDRVIVDRGGQRTEIAKPAAAGALIQMVTDLHGAAYVTAWNASTFDTILSYQVPLSGGPWTKWFSSFAERGFTLPLTGGGLLVQQWPTQQSSTLYRVAQPNRMQKLGTIPRPIDGLGVSRDLKRATVYVRDYHGDAWMSRVVRP
ncbi:MAG: protein kinase [Gemmatimonadales bacterium]